MEWIEELMYEYFVTSRDDENVFPTRADVAFPKNFPTIVAQIFKRLFRVYAHMYYSHFAIIKEKGEEPVMNTSFKHFYYFVKEFNLVSDNDMAPLAELIGNLTDRP